MALEKEFWPRKSAADLRDEVVKAREDAVAIREQNVAIKEQQAMEEKFANASATSLDNLRKANEHLIISGVRAQVAAEELEDKMDEMRQKASYDQLTQLPNRLLLASRLADAILAAEQTGSQVVVLFGDLDKFKEVNDTYGHAVGDQLLIAVSRRLLACTRKLDTVSRQGGDEFVILLNQVEGKEDAAAIAQKICHSVSAPYHVDGNTLEIGIAIGICMVPADYPNTDAILKNADAAMYEAKRAGGNNYRFFSDADGA